ncbi:hypothetical protein TSUD_02390 [Trifolium subterraneum]|uniref:Prolamin-like domain-containing protein n=1 Tax=Trifolium subterraneum TaxID=3900 RepID=A0A2Z6NBX3_TRISU|nr:hypothetical protein TSUD_02390 [Trifolium subterraneum]
MAFSKLLAASLLASLLLLHLVHAADQSIVMEHALQGVVYHLVQDCAKELVGLVVEDVIACHLALMATKKSVLVMPA